MIRQSKSRYIGAMAVLIIAGIFSACTKKEITYIDVEEPGASVIVEMKDPYYKYVLKSTTNFVDSTFYFKVTSDSASNITYFWDFGDGTTSNQRNARHKYSEMGKYQVKLTTTRDNIATSVWQQELTVINVETYLDLFGDKSAIPTDIQELKNNDILVLGYSYPSSGLSERKDFIAWLSAGMKLKSNKIFDNGMYLGAIIENTDGSLVAIGTLSGKTDYNEVIKMTAAGERLWSKTFTEGDHFQTITQTPDGGYILTGSRKVTDQLVVRMRALVKKIDSEGKPQWERFFGTGDGLSTPLLDQAANVIVETDGYVFAANKQSKSGNSCKCDSLAVIKLSPDGKDVWKKTVMWGLNREDQSGPVISSKHKNGTYIFGSYDGLYIFSTSGEFLDRKLLEGNMSSLITTTEGNIQTSRTGPSYVTAYSHGYDENGVVLWYYTAPVLVPVNGGWQNNLSSIAGKLAPLKAGGSILSASYFVSGTFKHVPFVVKIDKNGKAM